MPLSSRGSEQQNDALEPANNSLTRSTSHDTLTKQLSAATPTNQPPSPIFTPSCRPRPTPSPTEEQPDMKRVRPENNDVQGDSESIQTTETPVNVGDESDDEREREKARREKNEAWDKKREQRRAQLEEMRQERLRREEERQRHHHGNYYRRGYRGY